MPAKSTRRSSKSAREHEDEVGSDVSVQSVAFTRKKAQPAHQGKPVTRSAKKDVVESTEAARDKEQSVVKKKEGGANTTPANGTVVVVEDGESDSDVSVVSVLPGLVPKSVINKPVPTFGTVDSDEDISIVERKRRRSSDGSTRQDLESTVREMQTEALLSTPVGRTTLGSGSPTSTVRRTVRERKPTARSLYIDTPTKELVARMQDLSPGHDGSPVVDRRSEIPSRSTQDTNTSKNKTIKRRSTTGKAVKQLSPTVELQQLDSPHPHFVDAGQLELR
ncbi:hypothetical protein MPER_13015 [Moniliophthora perniciosa FA553]|nr:hypothetical protein MPER_13015 [Moniliophthora perniciosa FA553]